MPPVFSKPVIAVKSHIKRSFEAPIPFVPQADKNNIVKAREIKAPLRSVPTVATSAKIQKVFTEFVESTPESYCRWRCDVEEYTTGTGASTATAKLNIAALLLGQQHKETWDTIVAAELEGEEADDDNVNNIMESFALIFMPPTARRLQKRYMCRNVIENTARST